MPTHDIDITIAASTGGNEATDAGKLLEFNTQGQIQGSASNSALAAVKGTASGTAYGVHGESVGGTGVVAQSTTGNGIDASSQNNIAGSFVAFGAVQPVLHVSSPDATNAAPLAHFHRDDNQGMEVVNDGGLGWTSPTGAQTTAANLPAFGTATKGVVPASGGGTSNFLRADGTFAVPAGTGIQDGNTLTVGLTFPNMGLKIINNAADDEGLIIRPAENLTADRTLSIVVGDADRQLTIAGTASVSGTNTGDQTSVSGNAGTVSDIGNLTGVVTSVNRATAIADGALSIAKTSGLQAALDLKAPLASPTFTGTPAAPTAATGTDTTQIATTQFVQQEIDALVVIGVLASTQTTTSATLVDVTGFTAAVTAGATYQIEGFVICQTATPATNGIWLSLNGPTIGAGSIVHNWSIPTSATASNQRNNTGYNTGSATADSPAIDTDFGAFMNGVFKVGATGGTLQVRFASENAGTTVRVMAGSSIKLTRVA